MFKIKWCGSGSNSNSNRKLFVIINAPDVQCFFVAVTVIIITEVRGSIVETLSTMANVVRVTEIGAALELTTSWYIKHNYQSLQH
jgi:hypothetical protein